VPRYPSHQHFSKPIHSFKTGIQLGKEIWGIIRTLAVNGTSILVCSMNDGKSVAQLTSDEIVMGAEWVFCGFSVLVSQQTHSNHLSNPQQQRDSWHTRTAK
jgi:hypothetical protein